MNNEDLLNKFTIPFYEGHNYKNRIAYVEKVLEQEKGELSAQEEEVLKSMAEQEILSRNLT